MNLTHGLAYEYVNTTDQEILNVDTLLRKL